MTRPAFPPLAAVNRLRLSHIALDAAVKSRLSVVSEEERRIFESAL